MSEELVQYFVVNKDLIKKYNMSAGKIAAQVGHVATICTYTCVLRQEKDFFDWYNQSQTKIILKAKQKELEKLIDEGFYYVKDNGRTEIPSGSLTVVGLPPMTREKAKKYVGKFQTL